MPKMMSRPTTPPTAPPTIGPMLVDLDEVLSAPDVMDARGMVEVVVGAMLDDVELSEPFIYASQAAHPLW